MPDDTGNEMERAAAVRLRVRPHCPRIVRAVLDSPWVILPDKLEAIAEFIELRAVYGAESPFTFEARGGGDETRSATRARGSVAVLPVLGTLIPRANMVTEMSGGTSTQRLAAEFQQLVDNPQISSIVLDIDSPGGAVHGIPEFGDQVYAAREVKPIVAVANSLCASGAYWLASQANEIVVTPSGLIGSIGVVGLHQDMSKRQEREGITTTMISAGRYKTEGNLYEPLGSEARAAWQAQVDAFYDAFVSAVARGRGVDGAAVRNGFGQGRAVMARVAVKEGMADRIATLDQTVTRLLTRRPALPRGPQAAQDQRDYMAGYLETIAGRVPDSWLRNTETVTVDPSDVAAGRFLAVPPMPLQYGMMPPDDDNEDEDDTGAGAVEQQESAAGAANGGHKVSHARRRLALLG